MLDYLFSPLCFSCPFECLLVPLLELVQQMSRFLNCTNTSLLLFTLLRRQLMPRQARPDTSRPENQKRILPTRVVYHQKRLAEPDKEAGKPEATEIANHNAYWADRRPQTHHTANSISPKRKTLNSSFHYPSITPI